MSVQGYAIALIGLFLFNAVIVSVLAAAALRYQWNALRERALAGGAITVGSFLAAAIAWNLLAGWGWDAESRLLLLFLALAVPSLANLSWIVALATGKFREDER